MTVEIRGYLDDGTVYLMPGVCALDPAYENEPIMDIAATAGHVYVFRAGQDYHTLRVVGGCERFGQGDGEWWLYNFLLALGGSGLGDLAIEGNLYPNAFFVNGKGRVRCSRGAGPETAWVEYELTFIQSTQEKTVAVGTPPKNYPEPMAAYEGKDSSRTYTFDGAALGLISDGGLEIAVRREVLLNAIPKAYGCRIENMVFGQSIEFGLTMSWKADTHGEWNEWFLELTANQGDEPATLAGCGNAYGNCHMISVAAPHGADPFGHVKKDNIEFRFRQEYAVSVDHSTLTNLDFAHAGHSGFVSTATAQTITAVKTFTVFPVGPSSAPTSDYEFANKKYVDEHAGGGGSGLTHPQVISRVFLG